MTPLQRLNEFETLLLEQGASPGQLIAQGQIAPLRHYPDGDVFDRKSQSQFYFHRHQNAQFGHFHLFLRPRGLIPVLDASMPVGPHPAHLVAVQIDDSGFGQALFTTNQWVTAETYYPADILSKAVPRFSVNLPGIAGVVGQWLTLLVQAYALEIQDLIKQREAKLQQEMARGRSLAECLTDPLLEVMSWRSFEKRP